MKTKAKKEIVNFKKVSKKYGSGANAFYALKETDFSIQEGEFVVILGPSGAGKSTLLNLLGGMDAVTEGEIWIGDQNISRYNDNRLTDYRAKDIGFIFQFYNLIPTLTALENVMLTEDIVKDCKNGKEVLNLVGLKDKINQFPAQLSGGEQQRVSIARALSKNPLLLLCDEPTGALDSDTGVEVLSLLRETCKVENKTVIIVTHNAVIAPAADKVIHMKNGEITKIVKNAEPIALEEVNW